MTSTVRILTSYSSDSSPSIVLTSASGGSRNILVNCGEGCQRSFLEHVGLRVRSISTVALCRIGHAEAGGLPGMVLTSADAADAGRGGGGPRTSNDVLASSPSGRGGRGGLRGNSSRGGRDGGRRFGQARSHKRKGPAQGAPRSREDLTGECGMRIIGPHGTSAFLRSLQHFMRRERFPIDVHEGEYRSVVKGTLDPRGMGKKKKQKGNKRRGRRRKVNADDSEEDEGEDAYADNGTGFSMQSIPCWYETVIGDKYWNGGRSSSDSGGPRGLDRFPGRSRGRGSDLSAGRSRGGYGCDTRAWNNHDLDATRFRRYRIEVCSYVFTTPRIPGKFLVEKARELGIPPGPLYAQLKAGRSVTVTPIDAFGADGEKIEQRTVHSHQVVSKGCVGAATAVLFCPTMEVLYQLSNSKHLKRFERDNCGDTTEKNNAPTNSNTDEECNEHGKIDVGSIVLDCMIHITPQQVMDHEDYQLWMRTFGPTVQHIFLPVDGCGDESSPFRSSLLGAVSRSFIHKEIFPAPPFVVDSEALAMLENEAETSTDEATRTALAIEGVMDTHSKGTDEATLTKPNAPNFVSDSRGQCSVEERMGTLSTHTGENTTGSTSNDLGAGAPKPTSTPASSPIARSVREPSPAPVLEVNSEIGTGMGSSPETNIRKSMVTVQPCNGDEKSFVLNKESLPKQTECHGEDHEKSINETDAAVEKVEYSDSAAIDIDTDDDNCSDTISVTGASGKKPTWKPNVVRGRPMMQFILIPRTKKGLDSSAVRSGHGKICVSRRDYSLLKDAATRLGALDLAREIVLEHDSSSGPSSSRNVGAQGADKEHNRKGGGDKGNLTSELLFTGTGSALPCKHRNVTGMYLRMNNGNAILLDVGEGTVGQLCRAWGSAGGNGPLSVRPRLSSIRAAWISHPHADHHLGLIRLLSERNAQCPCDPLVLMAPVNLLRFLDEYRIIDPTIEESYIPVECLDMVEGKMNPVASRLYKDLGITACFSVPVAHCPHSYAVVIDGTSFGRVVYSGDCRPSDRLAKAGAGADLLIHEATFEDGMEEEAVLKRHSTVGEALCVGRKMRAKAVVLTHFSQRYPRIPPLSNPSTDGDGDTVHFTEGKRGEEAGARRLLDYQEPPKGCGTKNPKIVFAFDFMSLKPWTIHLASRLTPALRLLYPNTSVAANENDDVDEDNYNFMSAGASTADEASEILSVPGAFASEGIL